MRSRLAVLMGIGALAATACNRSDGAPAGARRPAAGSAVPDTLAVDTVAGDSAVRALEPDDGQWTMVGKNYANTRFTSS